MIPAKQYQCIHSELLVHERASQRGCNLPCVPTYEPEPEGNSSTARVCKWFDDLVKRVLRKELCRVRSPKMTVDLQSSGSQSIDRNWRALAKLLIYCSGSSRGGLYGNLEVPGHFVCQTRFSRTEGSSFLMPPCKNDVLYLSDPCEHFDQSDEGDVGFGT